MTENMLTLPDDSMELVLVDPLEQRHIERFFSEMRKLNAKLAHPDDASTWELNGNFLRAACISKIIESGLVFKDIATMNGGHVQYLALKLDNWMAERTAVPKD